uniref:Uncharacterized protein n=1 Tax=Oryza punctata TaxID=4537 RepID=A0A0E0MH98_ORYPU
MGTIVNGSINLGKYQQDIKSRCASSRKRATLVLIENAQKALVPGAHGAILSGNILRQAATLASALITEGPERCWEILSDVWVHLFLDIAPSSNAEAHAEGLKFNVDIELITLMASSGPCFATAASRRANYGSRRRVQSPGATPLDGLTGAVMSMFSRQSPLVHLLLNLQKFM